MSKRREAREMALQALFQNEFLNSDNAEKILAAFSEGFPISAETAEFTKGLLFGVFENLHAIDELIDSRSEHWSTKRMPLVDLNIIRIAVFELRFSKEDTPEKAIINEAIEIGKKYGGSNSAQFINGLLDTLKS